VNTWQALFIGVLQGATELFPVSSLGHAVLVPGLLRWGYRQSDPAFVPFLTLLHLGTAGALLLLYRREWVTIVSAFVRGFLRGRFEGADERLALMLVLATVPGGLVGFVLEKALKGLFASPRVAAGALIVNGVILLGAEWLRRRSERGEVGRAEQEAEFKPMSEITAGAALVVGVAQAMALIPGISRSGVTMAGGLVAGLRHRDAAEFSFLMATPIIGAAGLLEVPKLFQDRSPSAPGLPVDLAAAVLAGVAAYLSARFLVRYFRSGRLDPYGWYCAALGAFALGFLR